MGEKKAFVFETKLLNTLLPSSLLSLSYQHLTLLLD
jgi:hypothetical protein